MNLAELLGGLSLACDLADGFPPEKVLRTVVLAVGLGRRHGLAGEALRDVFYTSLLRYLGCTAFSHEEAHVYGAGDDIQTRQTMATVDAARPLAVVGRIVGTLGAGAPALRRARAVTAMLGDREVVAKHARSQCEASVRVAERIGLGAGVRGALAHICERWDGKGEPAHAEGEALPLAIRVSHVADITEIVWHREGREAAIAEVRLRRGGHFEPALADTFLAHAEELLDLVEGPSVWERYLEAEPAPRARLDAARLDDAIAAFADFADVKSVYTLGHSSGVARLAEAAAAGLGLPAEERAALRRAALLHDLGRVAVANAVWDKPAPLSRAEWERVRLHSYYTERILSAAPPLAALAPLAAADHERADGLGYHRALPASVQTRAARLLAAADALQALGEPRPHRPAFAREAAAKLLAGEAVAGRFDREAVQAVLEAAGAAPRRTPATWPAGLSDREVEVLRLLARGQQNKEIAAALGISPRTVQHHVMHVYGKIGLASRAAAALFASEHGLLE